MEKLNLKCVNNFSANLFLNDDYSKIFQFIEKHDNQSNDNFVET